MWYTWGISEVRPRPRPTKGVADGRHQGAERRRGYLIPGHLTCFYRGAVYCQGLLSPISNNKKDACALRKDAKLVGYGFMSKSRKKCSKFYCATFNFYPRYIVRRIITMFLFGHPFIFFSHWLRLRITRFVHSCSYTLLLLRHTPPRAFGVVLSYIHASTYNSHHVARAACASTAIQHVPAIRRMF